MGLRLSLQRKDGKIEEEMGDAGQGAFSKYWCEQINTHSECKHYAGPCYLSDY